jgi:hypothetical protein
MNSKDEVEVEGVDGKDMDVMVLTGIELLETVTRKVRCWFRYESTSFYQFLVLVLFGLLRA